MEVTEFGMYTDVRLPQPSKAKSPIMVTELLMDKETNSVQPAKDAYPIMVTEFGMIEFLQPMINVFELVSIMAWQLPLES